MCIIRAVIRAYISLGLDAEYRCGVVHSQSDRLSADTSPAGEAARQQLRPSPRCLEMCRRSSPTTC